jgi:hypothetical protein
MPPHDPHRGGCAFCRWISVTPQGKLWNCTHPAYPVALTWDAARNDPARCGSAGRLWELRLELTPLKSPPPDFNEGSAG